MGRGLILLGILVLSACSGESDDVVRPASDCPIGSPLSSAQLAEFHRAERLFGLQAEPMTVVVEEGRPCLFDDRLECLDRDDERRGEYVRECGVAILAPGAPAWLACHEGGHYLLERSGDPAWHTHDHPGFAACDRA